MSSVDMPAPEPVFQSMELEAVSLAFGSLQKVRRRDRFFVEIVGNALLRKQVTALNVVFQIRC